MERYLIYGNNKHFGCLENCKKPIVMTTLYESRIYFNSTHLNLLCRNKTCSFMYNLNAIF